MQHELPRRVEPSDARRARPTRVVVIQGQSFSVREEIHHYAGAPITTLIFASDRVARRVREYPRDWHTLPDEVLAQLSWHR